MTQPEPFETLFAVPLKCESCVQAVSGSLHELPGIINVDVKLKEQLVQISGTIAPSEIVRAIQSTGRTAILRGSGKQGAAVSILETHAKVANPVRGLARMIQVSPKLSIVDLSVYGCSPGRYYASVRENGDISQGAASTGAVWRGTATGEKEEPRGRFGEFEVDESGAGSVFLTRPVEIWELIGRSLVVSKKESGFATNDPDTLCGVIARSAGVWENEKTVCACSGKTIWEERTEQVNKGMI
ncbi:superoxide dismutase [Tricharina praecox]|uniref:superoxide dismutase n=1 Tax=Tricharina praecox TaxID=43433 RepID=UPI00221E423A|nr:superoxide dismutase [Tricharina praecox]KAI5843647.1 superoxide dismutase [Tricharina praecox]